MSRYPDEEPVAADVQLDAVDVTIVPRVRDLGDFAVRRVLPFAKRRLVGPFIFFDHMGPTVFKPGEAVDVRPHPHIGLATVTYLFAGEIMHRDSLGSAQPIRPGAVNWMTAGRGIVHSERTPSELRGGGAPLHGIQTWVALPKSDEETEPAFSHHPARELPVIEGDGSRAILIAGRGWGVTAPVPVFSDTLYADVHLQRGGRLQLPRDAEERGVYALEGTVSFGGRPLEIHTLVVFKSGTDVVLRAESDAHVIVVGGATMDGPRHIWWNFVASSEQRIVQAKEDWRAGRFPKVPGDEVEFIPLPD